MSYVREPFEQLDVMNYFMFNKLTTRPETSTKFCKCLIKNLIGREVENISVHAEALKLPDNPNKRGVRLDVQVNEHGDGENIANIYDFEPHRDTESAYPRKNRFTQAMIDKENLESGERDFSKLPDLFIVCITNYDPFGYDRMVYTIKNVCTEEPGLEYNDGVRILYFNTKGTIGGDEGLKNFLNYLETSESENIKDDATREISDYVDMIKDNYEAKGDYMTWGDLYDKMTAEAVSEAVAEAVAEVTEEKNRLLAEKDEALAEKDEALAEQARIISEMQKELEMLKK